MFQIEGTPASKPKQSLKTGETENLPPSYFKFFLPMPLYQDASDKKHPKPSGKFIGVLSLAIDLGRFLADQLLFADSEMSLHQVWIIDRDGRLLFQTEHRDMVLRNIHKKDESCNQCHVSFEYVEEILRKKQGTAEYHVRGSPKKLAALAPMAFGNASWIVVVNSSYDQVTALWK